MKPHVCDKCGQPLPRDYLFVGSAVVQLKGKRRILYDAVVKAGTRGVGKERLMDLLYGDDPNGGPESASILSSTIRHVNNVLASTGKRIRSTGMGQGEHVYVLRDL